MKGISKFDHDMFGNYDEPWVREYAVSKQKYSKYQAAKIAARELGVSGNKYLTVCNGWARYQFWRDEDNEETRNGWILYAERQEKGCPCYVFREIAPSDIMQLPGFEYILVADIDSALKEDE